MNQRIGEKRFLMGKFETQIIPCSEDQCYNEDDSDCEDCHCLRVRVLEDCSITVMAKDVNDNMEFCLSPMEMKYYRGQATCFLSMWLRKKASLKSKTTGDV